MDKPIEHVIFMSELSEEQRHELRRAVASDAKLADVCRRWQRVRALARRRLDEEIGDAWLFYLFALYRAGRTEALTPEELEIVASSAARFEALLARRPAIAHVVRDVARSADAFSTMWDAQLGDAGSLQGSITDGIQGKPVRTIPARTRDAVPRRHLRSSALRWVVRSAIAVAVLAFGFLLTLVIQRDAGMTTVTTADGETRTIELAAGSRIRLFGSSQLSYFDPGSTASFVRQASVKGRAFFEIAPEERGFIVKTLNARVTVLGTTFGIEAIDRLTEVVLADGRLTLASEEDLESFVALEPGQMSRVVAGEPPLTPIAVELSERLAWTGLFVFQSTPFRMISERLSGHFGVPIAVDDVIANERVTGTFEQSQPLEEILTVIAEAVGASVTTNSSGEILITRQ